MHRSLKFVRNIARFCSRIHFPFSRKKISQLDIFFLLNDVQNGDVFFSHTRGELSNFGLSFWSHAGIYIDGLIYEATTHGVVASSPIYFLAKKDAIAIFRPSFSFDEENMAYFLNSNLNRPYDYGFEDSDKEFYCFELVARSFFNSSEISLEKKQTLIGKKFLSSSFIDSGMFQKIMGVNEKGNYENKKTIKQSNVIN